MSLVSQQDWSWNNRSESSRASGGGFRWLMATEPQSLVRSEPGKLRWMFWYLRHFVLIASQGCSEDGMKVKVFLVAFLPPHKCTIIIYYYYSYYYCYLLIDWFCQGDLSPFLLIPLILPAYDLRGKSGAPSDRGDLWNQVDLRGMSLYASISFGAIVWIYCRHCRQYSLEQIWKLWSTDSSCIISIQFVCNIVLLRVGFAS